jgi:hypothetical protein
MANDAMDVQGKAGAGGAGRAVRYPCFCACALCVWMGSTYAKNPICLSVNIPKKFQIDRVLSVLLINLSVNTDRKWSFCMSICLSV